MNWIEEREALIAEWERMSPVQREDFTRRWDAINNIKPEREAGPLSADEVKALVKEWDRVDDGYMWLVRAVEKAHGIA